MKRSNIIVILMVIGAYLFVSCGSKESVSLESNAWKMVSMDGKEHPSFQEKNSFTVLFSANDSTVSGSGVCNTFMGRYEVKDNKITIGMDAATMRSCPEMDMEHPYILMFGEINSYKIDNGELVLCNADEERARFIALEEENVGMQAIN